MKIHLQRMTNFGRTSVRACSWVATKKNVVDKEVFDTLDNDVKCQRCVRESQRRWKSSLIK
jgi:hypothetical protein